MSITLITPTHDRPVAFNLCQRWIERQTYSGEVQWIVADGGDTPAECRLGQTHIRTNPVKSGPESFRKNYVAALQAVKHDRVIVIEDDEFYRPEYVQRLVDLFETGDVVGQVKPRYYNVRLRRYQIHELAIRRTSLCQTGFRACAIPKIIEWISEQTNPIFFDSYLWRHLREFNLFKPVLDPESTLVTAIKGMPGTSGAGIGHTANSDGIQFHDPNGDILRKWCGDDADAYMEFYQP